MEKESKTPVRDQAVRDFLNTRHSAKTKKSYGLILSEWYRHQAIPRLLVEALRSGPGTKQGGSLCFEMPSSLDKNAYKTIL